jgi:hypothetical protein
MQVFYLLHHRRQRLQRLLFLRQTDHLHRHQHKLLKNLNKMMTDPLHLHRQY